MFGQPETNACFQAAGAAGLEWVSDRTEPRGAMDRWGGDGGVWGNGSAVNDPSFIFLE